jgi:hypothetical protein
MKERARTSRRIELMEEQKTYQWDTRRNKNNGRIELRKNKKRKKRLIFNSSI